MALYLLLTTKKIIEQITIKRESIYNDRMNRISTIKISWPVPGSLNFF